MADFNDNVNPIEKTIGKEVKKENKLNKIVGEMPHSLEAEMALLGCIMLDPIIQGEISATLKTEDFYSEAHKYIFNAMNEIVLKNKPIDFAILSETLEKNGTMELAGGINYVARLADFMPSTANYKNYLDIVKCDSMLRKLIRGASKIIDESKKSQDKGNAIAFAEKVIYDISQQEDTGDMVRVSSVIPAVMNTIDDLTNDKSSSRGLKTGFRGIDTLLNGLHKSDLIVIAARPSVGKTSFAMNIVENVALAGNSCAIFSLEMNKEQLVQRMLCSVAGVNMSHVAKGELNKTEWLKLTKAKELIANSKIYIDESAINTAQEMLSKCRRLKAKNGLDLIVIDYIQLMDSPTSDTADNRQQKVSDISRNLKILAKELNVPVIVLSQLSRGVEKEARRPQLSDLRESGAIEQDADIVMFIHRPDKAKNIKEKDLEEGKVKTNVAEILVEKHRNGATGLVELYFMSECTKFVNLDANKNPEGEIAEENAKPDVKDFVEIKEKTDTEKDTKEDDEDDIF
ncbi:MAG: replicative DNA helicase [Clostridia bacterium]|nr:replicative DNA helicase [Clostridia bacterium]